MLLKLIRISYEAKCTKSNYKKSFIPSNLNHNIFASVKCAACREKFLSYNYISVLEYFVLNNVFGLETNE